MLSLSTIWMRLKVEVELSYCGCRAVVGAAAGLDVPVDVNESGFTGFGGAIDLRAVLLATEVVEAVDSVLVIGGFSCVCRAAAPLTCRDVGAGGGACVLDMLGCLEDRPEMGRLCWTDETGVLLRGAGGFGGTEFRSGVLSLICSLSSLMRKSS